jgi:hypothetical protein
MQGMIQRHYRCRRRSYGNGRDDGRLAASQVIQRIPAQRRMNRQGQQQAQQPVGNRRGLTADFNPWWTAAGAIGDNREGDRLSAWLDVGPR